MRVFVWVLGGLCGLVWWVISVVLGAKSYGILGANPVTGPIAGALTGVAMTGLSIPVYRITSTRALLWFSPLTVYLSILVYGVALFTIRWGLNDFIPGSPAWKLGTQSVVAMWWGVTFLTPIAIPAHLLAYANHRLLRGMVVPEPRGKRSAPASA